MSRLRSTARAATAYVYIAVAAVVLIACLVKLAGWAQ